MSRRILLLLLPGLMGCSLLAPRINKKSPALYDMEEPLALHQEPADEQERLALPSGGFTGVYVTDARQSLEELGEAPEGVLVDRVVENSPGEFAGLVKGDLVLEADGKPIQYSSAWRNLELESAPGAKLRVLYDRAGAELEATIEVAARARAADRQPAQRFREEDRTGIVVRTATEVEARGAALGPGAGAVIVGMARTSPWRTAGLVYGDLIVQVGDKPVDHPNVLLAAIREAPKKGKLQLVYLRGQERLEIEVPVSRRAQEQQIIDVPLLYYYEKDGDRVVSWYFFAIYKHTRTAAARETRILWIFKFRAGDSDRLEEVK
ncbi:MAG: PDZ domain-containing protein [Planctomycetota bacterium]